MNVWLALSLILVVATIYLLMIEIFSVAFKLTGLSSNKISFQVASLLTSTGFTTTESELITNDKRRRKIAVACIYTGHIFSVAIMGLIINVFFSIMMSIGEEHQMPTFVEWYFIIFYVTLALFLVMLLLKIPPINRRFQKFLEKIAINSTKRSRNTNVITVFDMYGKHAVVEVVLNHVPEFAKDTPLYKMGLTKDFSINVLSIKRGNRILDVSKDTMFVKGDYLVMFGPINEIKQVFINSVDKSEDTIVIDKTNEINLINNYGDNALVEIVVEEVPPELENIKIKDSHLTDRYNITIGIIKRGDEYISSNKDTIIQKGDVITLFGPYKNIKHLFHNDETK